LRRILADRHLLRRGLKAAIYPLDLAAFTRSLARRAPGIIHAQWLLMPGWDAVQIRRWRKRGWKVVHTVHDPLPLAGTGYSLTGLGAEKLYRACDALVVHDQWSRQVLCRAGAPEEKIRVLPPGPPDIEEPAAISREQARAELGLPGDARVVLFFGHIKPYKGLDLLLAAWPEVERAVGPAYLLVGGAFGQPCPDYRRRAAALGLNPERVRFSGRFLSPGEKDIYFAASNLTALPYRRASSSGVLLSSYLRSRPVVASAVGGLPELVDSEVTGLLTAPQNPDALARNLIRLLKNPGRLDEMGQAARHRLDKYYSWPRVANLTARMYRNL
jgi:glycosyltransferase involved in cell wall biosynthesis